MSALLLETHQGINKLCGKSYFYKFYASVSSDTDAYEDYKLEIVNLKCCTKKAVTRYTGN